MATNDILRVIDYVAIILCILVMAAITSVFIKRQRNYPSPVNVFGGLSSFTCFTISCVATVYLAKPDLPCDFRAYFMATMYWLCNMFLFCHFFAKSRLLVGVVPEDEGTMQLVLRNPFRRGNSVLLRIIDIIFLGVIAAYFFTGVVNMPTVVPVRSPQTNLCTVGKPGLAQFTNVALVVCGNFMCLFAFVMPLRRIIRKTKQRSTTGKSLDRQKRLIKRTCIAIAVSILSLLFLYAVLIISNDAVLATYYFDFMVTQSVQLMSILPPKDTSKPGKVAVMSTKASKSGKSDGVTSTVGEGSGVGSRIADYNDESRVEYGSSY